MPLEPEPDPIISRNVLDNFWGDLTLHHTTVQGWNAANTLDLSHDLNSGVAYSDFGNVWINAIEPAPSPIVPDLTKMTDTDYERALHYRALGVNHYQTNKGFIYIGKGNSENPLKNFWGRTTVYSQSEVAGVEGANPRYDYYVKKYTWYEKFSDEFFSQGDKNNITRITTKFKNGLIGLDEALSLLKTRTGKDFVLVKDVPNKFVWKESAYHDEIADMYYYTDNDFQLVKIEMDKFLYCHAVTFSNRSICFYCNRSGIYYRHGIYHTMMVEDEVVCQEDCLHSLYRWRDGSFHWDREQDVPAYHSIARPWLNDEVIEKIGVELEIYSPDRRTLNGELPLDDIFGETDGSLCPDNGIELVGKPYSYSEYVSGKTKWNSVLDNAIKHGSYGFNPPDVNHAYGMHISLSRNMFKSNMHLAKFIVFFNMQTNLNKLVAQRDNIYSGKYEVRQKIVNDISLFATAQYHSALSVDAGAFPKTKGRHFVNTGKYEAVSVAQERVECRIFRSNLSWGRFMKNVEFCMAVKEYTEFASVRVVSDQTRGTPDFIMWLFRRPDFINLKRFLMDSTSVGSDISQVLEKVKYRLPKLKDNKVIDNR